MTDANNYIQSTYYIDSNNSAVVEKATAVTLGLRTDQEKAVALHNFVRDQIQFGFANSFWKQKASDVLVEKKGYCNTKSTLFVALLRSVNIPSRQIFVDISEEILSGFLTTGAPYVDHSYVEVYLSEKWIKTDSFILDTKLFNAAQDLLKKEKKSIGYGTVYGASKDWDGQTNSFSQFLLNESNPYLSKNIFGEYQDVSEFYNKQSQSHNGSWLARLFFPFVKSTINSKIEKIRTRINSF